MMSLIMMGLNPGPLVHALFPFIITISLVISMAWGLVFFSMRVKSKCDVVKFVVFVPIGVKYKGGRLIEKKLALKFLIFPPNFKISSITIVLV